MPRFLLARGRASVAGRSSLRRLCCAPLLILAAALSSQIQPAIGQTAAPVGVPDDVPGPAWLHRTPSVAPPLTNSGGWVAEPLLVSGASAYADGEYLSQDWVHDAYGANTTNLIAPVPDTTPSSLTGFAGAPTGDVVNPTDTARYGGDAADLLEVRVRRTSHGVAYRFTLNTMLVPDAVAVAVAIDSGAGGTSDWGYGLGSLGPDGVDDVLVTWGTGAEYRGAAVPSTVDTETNQIEVEIPADPGTATWRHWIVTGIWNGTAFTPVELFPTTVAPGGSFATNPPPVLNVGFRRDDQEPMGTDLVEGLGTRGVYGWGSYRDHAQAHALAARDIEHFHADIDFSKLATGAREFHGPTTGFINRLYSSRLDMGEGVHSGLPAGEVGDLLLGPIQPYAVYVPSTYDPATPAPLTILLHSAALVYNQYGAQTPEFLQVLGEERGAIVITPEARGQFNGYGDVSEVDVFEAVADLAHRYAIDFDRVTLAGNSMGAMGAFRLSSLYPDLFSSMFAIVGEGVDVIDILANLHNVPVLMWNALADELVPLPDYLQTHQRLTELGLRHRMDLYPAHDHIIVPMGSGTDFSRGAEFLGLDPIDRNPAHVDYTVAPAMADPQLDLVYDGAYWVEGMAAEGVGTARVRATSYARGHRQPVPESFRFFDTDPEPHLAQGLTWRLGQLDVRPLVDVELVDLAAVSIDLARAGLDLDDPKAAVEVTTNQRVELKLLGLTSDIGVVVDGTPQAAGEGSSATLHLTAGSHRVSFVNIASRSGGTPGSNETPSTGGGLVVAALVLLAVGLGVDRQRGLVSEEGRGFSRR